MFWISSRSTREQITCFLAIIASGTMMAALSLNKDNLFSRALQNECPFLQLMTTAITTSNDINTLFRCPILVGFRPTVLGSSSCIIINFLMHYRFFLTPT